jgi:hypothetical protein
VLATFKGRFEASLGISFPITNILNLSVGEDFIAKLKVYILFVISADHLSGVGFKFKAY